MEGYYETRIREKISLIHTDTRFCRDVEFYLRSAKDAGVDTDNLVSEYISEYKRCRYHDPVCYERWLKYIMLG